MSLDLLGALDSQYVTLRVKSIDVEKLKKRLGSTAGAAVAMALPIADLAPEVALKAVMPFAANKARNDYGVDLEYVISEERPKVSGSSLGITGGTVLKGLALAGAGWAAWRYGIKRFL